MLFVLCYLHGLVCHRLCSLWALKHSVGLHETRASSKVWAMSYEVVETGYPSPMLCAVKGRRQSGRRQG